MYTQLCTKQNMFNLDALPYESLFIYYARDNNYVKDCIG